MWISCVVKWTRGLACWDNLTPKETRKRLVLALLIPKFTYMSLIYMNCSRALWKQINTCFNSCTRYVFGLRKFDSISHVKNEVLGSKIENYIQFRTCLFLFMLLKKRSLLYLYDEITFPRFPRSRTLKVSNRLNVTNSKSFFVYGFAYGVPCQGVGIGIGYWYRVSGIASFFGYRWPVSGIRYPELEVSGIGIGITD